MIEQRWDRAGRLVERLDGRAAMVAWTHDPLGRVLEEHSWDPEGAEEGVVRYAYDALPGGASVPGQLLRVEDAAGVIAFTYDERGREIGRSRAFATRSRGAIELSHGVELDAQGRRVADRYPDGSRVSRSLSARGLEVGVGHLIPDLERDGEGRWTAMVLANGATVRRSHDEVGRTARLEVAGGTKVLDLAYDYDPRGLLAAVHDGVGATAHSPALDQRFVHDDLGRLVGAGAAYGDLVWGYSPAGNLLEQGGETIGYDPLRPHAAVSLGGQHIGYDGAGQMTSVEGEGPIAAGAWGWDAHGRVERVDLADGGAVEHIYGHDGERAIRRDYGPDGELRDEVLYLDRSVEVREDELVRWVDVDGARVVESPVHLPEGGFPGLGLMGMFPMIGLGGARRRRRRRQGAAAAGLLTVIGLGGCGRADGDERVDGGEVEMDAETRFHVHDRLGSAALVLDHEGEVTSRAGHRPWGEEWFAWNDASERGPIDVFTGRERDPGSDVIYIGARHYVPALGRWASPDPLYTHLDPAHAIEKPGERNVYRYAGNDPVNMVDPDGYETKDAVGGASFTFFGFHRARTAGVVWDDSGNVAIRIDRSSRGAGLGAEAGVTMGRSDANTVNDLRTRPGKESSAWSFYGPEVSAGFSKSEGTVTGGTEGTIIETRAGAGLGAGASSSEVETEIVSLGNMPRVAKGLDMVHSAVADATPFRATKQVRDTIQSARRQAEATRNGG